MSAESKIAFLPAGGMNIALAIKAYENGYEPTLWFHSQQSYDNFRRNHRSKRLRGVKIPRNIRGTLDIAEALDGAGLVSFGPPSLHFREVVRAARPYLGEQTLLLSVTKGFDGQELIYRTPSQVIEEEIPNSRQRLSVMLGPNFAREIALGKITGTTVAAYNPEIGDLIKRTFHTGVFWVDLNREVSPLDAEVVGAFKNVAGLVMGFSYSMPECGENARAFLLQKGLDEVAKLCDAIGGNSKAIMELCGIGDYGLLTNSLTSRNVKAGYDFGMGNITLEQLKHSDVESDTTVEGVRTTKAIRSLSQEDGVRVFMPLTRTVYKVLYEGMDPADAIRRLLLRNHNSNH